MLYDKTKVKYLYVTDHGDYSALPMQFKVSVPFSRIKRFTDGHDWNETLESFRADVIALYDPFCTGRVTADYDFELFALYDQYFIEY